MSNWEQVKNGGKGSGRRSGANDQAYASGWDRIFGKGKEKSKKDEEKGLQKG